MIVGAARGEALAALRAAILAAAGVASLACDGGSTGPTPTSSARARSPWPPRPGIGYVKDESGMLHRPSPMRCETPARRLAPCEVNTREQACQIDADCSARPYGRCEIRYDLSGVRDAYCECDYACATDADCAPDEACLCADMAWDAWGRMGASRCIPAACKSDADCGGEACVLSEWVSCRGDGLRLACRTPDDECESTAECRALEEDLVCVYVGADRLFADGGGPRWRCVPPLCVIGRPFRVDGVSRAAPVTANRSWTSVEVTAALAPGASALSLRERTRIATRALEQARFEHASVGSFARTSLELLALGAPPDLLHDTARAMQDEIEHARLCFAIAQAHGAGEVGPGTLDLAGALPNAVDPGRIAYAVAYEGCVGETLGAIEGADDAGAAADPLLRDVLARIADDEQRHAVLAWRTLAWIVATFGDDARDGARRGIDEGLRDHAGEATSALRGETARLVIAPAAARVLG